MNRFQASEGEPVRDMQAVMAECDIPVEDYKRFRAMGSTLSDYGYDNLNTDCQKGFIATGVVYLRQALDLMRDDNLEKVKTLLVLAPKYTRLDGIPHAIRCYDQAYEILLALNPEDLVPEQQINVKDIQLDILIAKGKLFSKVKETHDALCMFNEARGVSGEKPLAGTILDDMTLLFNEENDVDGTKLMEVLKTWTQKERNSWFSYCFDGNLDGNAMIRMARAAKLAKETDVLLDWLATLAETIPTHSYYMFNVRGAIAMLHYPVLGDMEKGKTLRLEMLDMKPKPESWYEETMNEAKTECRMKLADIFFHEFQTSTDPAKKEKLIETLKDLPSAHDDKDNIWGSHVSMLRANMLRIMGPATKYQRYMNELFEGCIRGLEDGVSWNDSQSLRLLSKVLASLDGLERDARIASSAQFSILDRTIHGQDTESEGSETVPDKDISEPDTDDESAESKETMAESIETQVVVEAMSMPTTRTLMPSAFIPSTANGKPNAKASGGNQGSVAVLEKLRSARAKQPGISVPVKSDEDVNGIKLDCDGGCGTVVDTWSQPFYYCLVCPNCDLCEECHAKRLAQTRGEEKEPWLSFCGPHHRYIKAPIKGWKGIKNGVIRIGAEEFTVKDWLKGLKEERWQKGWDMFSD